MSEVGYLMEELMAKSMSITGVTVYKADIPLKETFRIAIMEITHAQNVFVRVETNNGLHGIGEASPFWRITWYR